MGALHRRRLREVWRSSGWPCRDAIELELLAAGMLLRHLDAQGRETLHVSDSGIQLLAATLQKNRAAFDAHEALVGRVTLEMQRAGRVVWRGLRLRAPLSTWPAAVDAVDTADPGIRWVGAMPDVFSIRHTTVEDYAEPVVHEIKVRRADLLADLRRGDKGAAYSALASQCWYVLAAGIADADEVPAAYGVMVADCSGSGSGLTVLRPAPRRAMRLPFGVWMALARANAEPGTGLDLQEPLSAMPVFAPVPPAPAVLAAPLSTQPPPVPLPPSGG